MDIALIQEQFSKLIAAYPMLSAMVILPLLTGVANLLIWYFSSDRWPEFLNGHPRVAAACKILKALGLDPVGLVRWTHVLITGRVLPPSPPDANGTPPAPPADRPAPPPTMLLKVALAYGVFGVVLGLVVPAVGCSAADRQKVVTTADTVMDVACIVLRGRVEDGTLKDICATADELSPLVHRILALRRYKAAHPAMASGAGEVDACTVPE